MHGNKLTEIVKKFNTGINNRNIKIVSELMTDSQTFIDSANNRFEGKKVIIKSWEDFFESFPDYQNHFQKFFVESNFVKVIGFSSCSFTELNGGWIWTAIIKDGKIDEWRIYKDSPQNRRRLNIKAD